MPALELTLSSATKGDDLPNVLLGDAPRGAPAGIGVRDKLADPGVTERERVGDSTVFSSSEYCDEGDGDREIDLFPVAD